MSKLIDKEKDGIGLPMKWAYRPLGSIAAITMGNSPSGESYNDDGIGVPLVNGPVEFSEGAFGLTRKVKFTTSPTKMCNAGDFLICVRGSTTGRTNIASFDACIGRGVASIRANFWQPYLNHFIRTLEKRIHASGKGSTFPSISQQQLADLSIPLPCPDDTERSMSEQKRIADILDKADAIRRKRQRAIGELENYIPSLFIEMFGDPDVNPKQWEVVPISYFVQRLEGGKNFKTDDKPSAETRYMILKVSAVTWGEYKAHECKPVPPAFEPPRSYFVQPGDLLMSRANTRELIGAAVYVDETPDNIILPDKIWRFVWKQPNKVEPLFVHSLLRHPYIQGEIGRRSSGTSGSMKNIAKPKVFSIPVPLPPLSAQQGFAAQVRRIRKTQKRALLLQNESDTLFSSLVQRAFKGVI